MYDSANISCSTLYVCACVCACACMCVCVCVPVRVLINLSTGMYHPFYYNMLVCTIVLIFHVPRCMCVRVHVRVHVCAHAHVRARACARARVFACTHLNSDVKGDDDDFVSSCRSIGAHRAGAVVQR